jgi:hypothetical protein
MMLAACLLSLALQEPATAPAADVAAILRALAPAGGFNATRRGRALATLPHGAWSS